MRKNFLPAVDFALAPFVYLAGSVLKKARQLGLRHLPRSASVLRRLAIYPIRNHYYEPQFLYPADADFGERELPGIDWNAAGQLEMLQRFTFAQEIDWMPERSFGPGDAEYWYQIIRACKPRRIVEVGSGNSTLMAIRALERNRAEGYDCRHVCIEPFENTWLREYDVEVVRERVESLGIRFFSDLEAGDILFIDSSHMIRPHGDVVFEYLQLLPSLPQGVIVHIHDIFSPENYPKSWLVDRTRFWNEQYLVEAFLSHNKEWEIVGALNFLQKKHHEKLKTVAPHLTQHRRPGSFYIRRVI